MQAIQITAAGEATGLPAIRQSTRQANGEPRMITLELTREDADNLTNLIEALNAQRGPLRGMEDALRGAGQMRPAAFLHDLRQTIVLGSFALEPVIAQCRQPSTLCGDQAMEVRP